MNHFPPMEMSKYAHYAGRADIYLSLGIPEEQVKVAFLGEGLSAEEYAFVKEAFVGRLLAGAGKAIQRWAGRAPTVQKLLPGAKFTRVGASDLAKGTHGMVAKSPLQMTGRQVLTGGTARTQSPTLQKMVSPEAGRVTRWAGETTQRAGQAIGKGLENLGKNPWQTTKGFGRNVFRGMLFSPTATGVGGAVGKGYMLHSLGSMLAPPGQMQTPRPMHMQGYRPY